MKCPTCNVTLLMSDKQGVEIDYCPQCRGVWLDRGELEKILDRMQTDNSPQSNSNHVLEPHYPENTYDPHHDDRRHSHERHDHRRYKKKNKFEFLSDIFEFGD